MSAEDRLRAFADSNVPPPTPMRDLKGRIARRRHRRRLGGATAALAIVAGVGLAVVRGEDAEQLDTIDESTTTTLEPSTSSTSTSTTTTNPSTTTTSTTIVQPAPGTTAVPGAVDADAATAALFHDAWVRGDRDAMLGLTDPGPVDLVGLALDYFGRPTTDPACVTRTDDGVYDCEVHTTSGRRAYFLIGEPGASERRIWWLGETAPGEGGGP